MTAAIDYFITGASFFTLVALWFFYAYKILFRKRKDLQRAEDQVKLHLEDCYQMRGSPGELSTGRMLEISSQIYQDIEMSYNKTFGRLIYRFPGLLMGFRKVGRNSDLRTKEE